MSKLITDPPRWRIESDGTGCGTRVFAPGGEEVSNQVRAVRWELGPHEKGKAPIAICTLELLAVEVDVQVEKPLITRYAYCREHGGHVPVDGENRHVETEVFTGEPLRAGMMPGAIRRGEVATARRCAGYRCGRTDADFPDGGEWMTVESGRLLCPLCATEGQGPHVSR